MAVTNSHAFFNREDWVVGGFCCVGERKNPRSLPGNGSFLEAETALAGFLLLAPLFLLALLSLGEFVCLSWRRRGVEGAKVLVVEGVVMSAELWPGRIRSDVLISFSTRCMDAKERGG
jgi:hypothetical protein